MWSGSEGGVIKIWPWESIEKSLSFKPAERHMAALLVERSAFDLRSQVTVNGTCSISSAEIKSLLADNVRAKVWAVQPQSFSLWYIFLSEENILLPYRFNMSQFYVFQLTLACLVAFTKGL